MRAFAWLLALSASAGWACSSQSKCDVGVTCSQGGDAQGGGSNVAGADDGASANAGEPSAQPSGGQGVGGVADEGGAGGALAGGAPSEAVGGAGGSCDPEPVVVGTLESAALTEVSGIVASAKNPGVYYVHNDSGDSARFFAIDEQGRTLAELVLAGATAVDWEDIALGPGPGGESYVYLGDVGDNEARVGGTPRASIDVYRVPERLILSDEAPSAIELTNWERLPLSYPGPAHDCEALLLDPLTSELLLLTKENDGKSSLFRASALVAAGAAQTLDLVTQIGFSTTQAPGSSLVTGAEMSPRGERVLVRTYTSVFQWLRAPETALAEVFAGAPQVLPPPDEEQGEAITFSADGRSFLTVSENERASIFRAPLCDL